MAFEKGFAAEEACLLYDEFTVCSKRRTSASPGMLFCRLAQLAVQAVPAPHPKLIAHNP